MATLYAIQCWFKPLEKSDKVYGLAICKDPDTPETFIFPDGHPFMADEIWDYKLMHYQPWAQFDMPSV